MPKVINFHDHQTRNSVYIAPCPPSTPCPGDVQHLLNRHFTENAITFILYLWIGFSNKIQDWDIPYNWKSDISPDTLRLKFNMSDYNENVEWYHRSSAQLSNCDKSYCKTQTIWDYDKTVSKRTQRFSQLPYDVKGVDVLYKPYAIFYWNLSM